MRSNVRKTKKRNSRGFTMVELMVTLAVMGILLAITFVGLNAWIRNSEFKKCNEYAHTIYTAASLELSSLELASDLDRFTAQVKNNGTCLQDSSTLGNNAPEDIFDLGRMYAITAKAGEYDQYCAGTLASTQANLVYDLIDNYSYDKEVCDYTITIEYDTVSQSVYAVYISSWAKEFVYSDDHSGDYKAYDEKGVVSLNATGEFEQNRSYEVRKALMVGYYCVEELGVNAAFNEGQLHITQCYIDNGETLDLVVASNSRHGESDVKYTATIYKKGASGDQKLFDVTYSLVDLYAKGYTTADVASAHLMKFKVSEYVGGIAQTPADMYFPISFVGQELRVTLDAIMSAQSAKVIDGVDSARNISTSFRRFLKNQAELPDIYASARVEQLMESDLPASYDQGKHGVRLWIESEDYITGSSVSSNIENAFYASVKGSEVGIGSSRHLANIRYYDTSKTTTFQVTEDIQFDDAIIYDQNTALVGYENAMELMEGHTIKAFPSIPEFSQNWTLTGEKTLNSQDFAINGIVLTEESVIHDESAQLGIVMQNKGVIRNLSVGGSDVLYGYVVSNGAIQKKPQDTANKVYAAGVLCGLNNGTIHTITMDENTSMHVALNYQTVGSDVTNLDKMQGIGLVCGVHNGNTALTDIQTAGELEGYFYDIKQAENTTVSEDDAVKKRYRFAGIGGVCGLVAGRLDAGNQTVRAIGEPATILNQVENFLNISDATSVKNTARITGNSMVGGIAGNIWFMNQTANTDTPIIENCANEGLIYLSGEKFNLVEIGDSTQDAKLNDPNFSKWADNCFAGGVVGFLQTGVIKDCTSAPGVNDSEFIQKVTDETLTGDTVKPGDVPETNAHVFLKNTLSGNFVGGIVGCVVDGELRDCRTNEGGYILGNDEVGGIVGYLTKTTKSMNRLKSTKEVQNGCYVLGHSDVGGIVGSNQAGNTIQNCVNEGVVVGRGRNIGGIVGKNIGTKYSSSIIENCTSEVFDYDGSIYQLVSQVWAIYGDNAGGLVGFNEYGEVKVKRGDDSKTNVSAIVVGNHNVGGVFGMAGAGTKFDFKHYTLDGGEVYALFDNAGGYIGVNLSEDALPKKEDLPTEKDKTYELRPYSVRGRYAVGGAIGANVLLQNNTDHSPEILFSNMNSFGTVYGANAVGGIIGYQRNVIFENEKKYEKVYQRAVKNLPENGFKNTFASMVGMTQIDGFTTVWLTDRKNYKNDTDYPLEPGNVKTTITGSNAATVIAGSYGGGILGYGCSYDKIEVSGCTNTGDVSDWQAEGVTGQKLIEGSVAFKDVCDAKIISADSDAYVKQALTDSMVASEPIGSFVGGIQGYVSSNTVIKDCTQKGMIYAQNGCGGIAGINLGKLENCHVLTNLGTQESGLIGGIAAINGKDVINNKAASVTKCNVGTATTDYTIEGKSIVGGFFAINESNEANNCTRMYANISCALDGSIVGGLTGINAGKLTFDDASGLGGEKEANQIFIKTPPLQINGGTCVGGVAGVMKGTLVVNSARVMSDKVSITGVDCVGGLFGEFWNGTVSNTSNYENAAMVVANGGCAGGIVGKLLSGQIDGGHNLGAVTAYGKDGYAGGIAAYVVAGCEVKNSSNEANITSMNSCAGGICAWNEGTLTNNHMICIEKKEERIIRSNDKNMGIIAAYNKGTIDGCNIKKASDDAEGTIVLQGSGSIIGGIVGTNEGTIKNAAIKADYTIDTASDEELTIGGAIGKNEWSSVVLKQQEVSEVSVENYAIELQGNCAYFGGLVGQSTGAGSISDCTVSGLTLTEKTASLRNSCYGGAIGSNESAVSNVRVKNILANVTGLYQANITLAAEKQENLTSCMGGIVGKNRKNGVVESCSLDTSDGYDNNQIIVVNGLVGGVTGINMGLVQTSGYYQSKSDSAADIMKAVKAKIEAYEQTWTENDHVDGETQKEKIGFERLEQSEPVKDMIESRWKTAVPTLDKKLWEEKKGSSEKTMEQWMKETLKGDQQLTMCMRLTGNGSLGGITACNTSTATLEYCISGRWYLDNRSASQYSALGGIIGTNESDQDTRFLVNQAMVLRESSQKSTERVNGGIIGNQHNMTSDQWTIYGCINTGMVVNYLSHYSGGIIGRWSDQGGSVEYCRNYGFLQTSAQMGWKGATGGIVAQLYHPIDHQSYTVLSCRNDGSIFGTGQEGLDPNNSANESGGILGNVIVYQADMKENAQPIQLNIVDCVNGPDVTIICFSMGGGILGYMNSDKAQQDTISLAKLELNIDRCRNYSINYAMNKSRGFSGIFGDRDSGHELTRITNCFTLADQSKVDDYTKKGYICNNNGSSTNAGWNYDGGKSAICYNNRVLLVDSDGKVDESVTMDLGSPQKFRFDQKDEGTCYPIVHDKTQTASAIALETILNQVDHDGNYRVSGSKFGPQIYIQLQHPMKLGDLKIKFANEKTARSYRVEYLTENETADVNKTETNSLSNQFTLAKEVIGSTGNGGLETVSLPENVSIYALRIQYVQSGVTKTWDNGAFQKYGYYYSNAKNDFTLTGLSLTKVDGTAVTLKSYGSVLTSPRLVDVAVIGDHLRNASTQYLYVAKQGTDTYLIEPQFEEVRLSSSSAIRKTYNRGSDYTMVGNELFYGASRPYGMIYAKLDSGITLSSTTKTTSETWNQLDAMIANTCSTALAAAMPMDDTGSLLPETPTLTDLSLNTENTSIDIKWKNSIDGAKYNVLYYLLTLKETGEDGSVYLSEKKCFGNEWMVDITSDMLGKKLQATVRAVNENGTSDLCVPKELQIPEKQMPTPQVRLEITGRDDENGQFTYRISLENQDVFEQSEADLGNWAVNIYRQGQVAKTKIGTLDASTTGIEIKGSDVTSIESSVTNYTPSRASWLLYAQALSSDASYLPSENYATSVYTPNDRKYTENDVEKIENILPGINQLYATFDENYESELDAKVNVHIQSELSKTGIYPVYQIDLIRVDGKGNEYILGAKELAVSNQLSMVTFTDLPAEFFDADSTQYFYVRAWLSQTGVGPVYSWHEMDEQEQASEKSLLVNTSPEEGRYVTGEVLSTAQSFGSRIVNTPKNEDVTTETKVSMGTGIDEEKYPVVYARTDEYALQDVPKLNTPKISYDATHDELKYTFAWTDTSTETTSYEFRVYGVQGESKIQIAANPKVQKGAWSNSEKAFLTTHTLTVDDWEYSKIEVVIIQRGTGFEPGDTLSDSEKKGKVVPRAAQSIRTIRTRLPNLSQPSVKLLNRNDLKYEISWQDISGHVESGYQDQIRYALYGKKNDDKKFIKLETTSQTSILCDFESDKYQYQGQNVQLYVVAYMDEEDCTESAFQNLQSTARYFKSPVGLWKTIRVGNRLDAPEFTDTPFAWNYRNYTVKPNHVLTEAQFTSNALKLDVKLKKKSNYVMNGVLFETIDQAENFIKQLKGTPYSQYVQVEQILADVNYAHLSGNGKPIMMNLKEKEDGVYTYTISSSFKDITYAGGYIVPLVRSTSTTKISSYWSWANSAYVQIPKVQLDTPNLNREVLEKTYETLGESFKNSVSVKGTKFTNVTVQHDSYRFSVPPYVKENVLTLTTKDGNVFTLTVTDNKVIVHTNQDLETDPEKGAEKSMNLDGSYDYTYTLSGTDERTLDVIRNAVSGTYRSSGTARAYYRMTFDTSIRREEVDGTVYYVLCLPQTRYAVTCDGGVAISGTSQLITDVFIQAIPKDKERYKSSKEKTNS